MRAIHPKFLKISDRRTLKREPLLGSLLSVSTVFNNPMKFKDFPMKTRSYSDFSHLVFVGSFRQFLAKV
jgi:hypothetical protein